MYLQSAWSPSRTWSYTKHGSTLSCEYQVDICDGQIELLNLSSTDIYLIHKVLDTDITYGGFRSQLCVQITMAIVCIVWWQFEVPIDECKAVV